jgi:MORN repeat
MNASCTHVHAQNGKEVKGRMYEGDWENGQYDGQGTLHLGNGDIYTGAFKVLYFPYLYCSALPRNMMMHGIVTSCIASY